MTYLTGYLRMSRLFSLLIVFSCTLFVWFSSDAVAARLKSLYEIFLEAVPVARKVEDMYKQMLEHARPVRLEFPSRYGEDVAKTQIKAGVSAGVRAAASAVTSDFKLTIAPNVTGANVQILSPKKSYKDGIRLRPGDYEILVEKEGYRSKRFWFSAPKGKVSGGVRLDVTLKPLGMENCRSLVELSNFNSGVLEKGGSVLQIKGLFKNSDINDVYLSYGKRVENLNFLRAYDSYVAPGYAEIRTLQATNLSKRDVEENRVVDVDKKRFILGFMIFEQRGDDVLVVNQSFLPKGTFVMNFDENWACDHVFNF